MKPSPPPKRESLPELPSGCDELRATTAPDADTRLRLHLKSLPGLGSGRADILANFAEGTTPPALNQGSENSRQSVLGLEDLIRTQTLGLNALHPRVQQVVPLGALDWLLMTVAQLLEIQTDTLAYQYPSYLLECRGAAPDKTTLYSPQYHIRTLEVLRELRGYNLLTTVCQGGEPLPQQDDISTVIDSMETRDDAVGGAFTLQQDEDSKPFSTALVFHGDVETPNTPDNEVLLNYCETVRDEFGVTCRVVDIS